MSVTLLKCFLLLACAAHLTLLHCGRIITLLDGGRFDFRALNDNEKLSAVMGDTPLERPMRSMVLGTFAMTEAFPGYLVLGVWMLPQSPVCGALMLAGGILFLLPGVAHHVFCGAVEWFLSAHEQDRRGVGCHREVFQENIRDDVRLLCWIADLCGIVLCRCCRGDDGAAVFNTLPLFLLLSPFHIVGTGNIANDVMFAGLFFLI